MEPISEDTWKQFNHKMQWDIITALRGPDIRYSDTIKWFTTNVIRHRMMNITNTHGSVNEDLGLVVLPSPFPSYIERGMEATNPVVEENGRKRRSKPENPIPLFAYWGADHFLQHTAEAAEFLGIPILYCPLEIWEKAMGERYYQAGITMLEGLKELAKEKEKAAKDAEENPDAPFIDSKILLQYAGRRRSLPSKKLVNELERHITKITGRW